MEWEEIRTQVQMIEGLLSEAEAECLYALARRCGGSIVEIGSWKGRSTVCLALGSKAGGGGKVFAIDPRKGLEDDCAGLHWLEDTYPIFRENIEKARVDDIVVPLVMKSEEAAREWTGPVSLLFIDGAHDYENVKLDFDLWYPHLIEGAIICFHDALYSLGNNYSGVRRVVMNNILKSSKFTNVQFCGSMVYATKSPVLTMKDHCLKFEKRFYIKYFAMSIWYESL